MQYTIVDNDVEVAPIYRCHGMDPQPTRPCENHSQAIEHLPMWLESRCKQQSKSSVVPVQGSLEKTIQSPGDTEMHMTSAARLRIDTIYNNNKLRIE